MNITYITLNENKITIKTSEKISIITDEVVITNYFNNLAKKSIKKMTRSSDKKHSNITFNDNTKIIINNFDEIKKKKFFKELNKKISIFKMKMIAKKLNGKKLIICGSIVGAVSLSTAMISDSEIEEPNNSITMDNKENDNSLEFLEPITIFLEEENEVEKIEEDYTGKTFAKTRTYDYYISEEDDIDPLYEEIENIKDIEAKPDIKFATNNNVLNDGLDYTKLETLKDINSYEGFTLLASNIYGVDYNKALELVQSKWNTFTSPGEKVNDSYAKEIDRMKDLVSRGFINGDLNVIGIFLTIKDYAIDYLDLSKQPAINSNKTPEEREKEILSIAKYIYGIDDYYLLNLIIATTRVESANFTSNAAINKNNIGGNVSTSATFDNVILNTYKTAEIGEESFVRNFLNCYGKSLVAHNYDKTLPIPFVMKDKLCPHSPDEWESVITEKVEFVIESKVVDNYLNIPSKTR